MEQEQHQPYDLTAATVKKRQDDKEEAARKRRLTVKKMEIVCTMKHYESTKDPLKTYTKK